MFFPAPIELGFVFAFVLPQTLSIFAQNEITNLKSMKTHFTIKVAAFLFFLSFFVFANPTIYFLLHAIPLTISLRVLESSRRGQCTSSPCAAPLSLSVPLLAHTPYSRTAAPTTLLPLGGRTSGLLFGRHANCQLPCECANVLRGIETRRQVDTRRWHPVTPL